MKLAYSSPKTNYSQANEDKDTQKNNRNYFFGQNYLTPIYFWNILTIIH